jgi:hypothetical protein
LILFDFHDHWRSSASFLVEGVKHSEFFRAQSLSFWMPARDDLRGSDRLLREMLEMVWFSSGAGAPTAPT